MGVGRCGGGGGDGVGKGEMRKRSVATGFQLVLMIKLCVREAISILENVPNRKKDFNSFRWCHLNTFHFAIRLHRRALPFVDNKHLKGNYP